MNGAVGSAGPAPVPHARVSITAEAVLVDLTQTTTVTQAGAAPKSDHETDAIALDPSTGVPMSEALYDQPSAQTVLAKLEGFTPLSSTGTGSG